MGEAQSPGYENCTFTFGELMKRKSSKNGREARKLELASLVAECVEIRTIAQVSFSASLGSLRDELPDQIELGVNVETGFNRADKTIFVRTRFRFAARYDAAEEDAVCIQACYFLHYSVPTFEGIRKANVVAFGELNGVHNAWPYWREFVQSATTRLGLAPLTLPVQRPVTASGASRKRSLVRPVTRRGKRAHLPAT